MTLDDYLSRCENVRPHKGYHMATCPAHDDTKGSLSIRVLDRIIRVKCFAGCTKDAILTAQNIDWRELYTDGHAPKDPPREGGGKGRRTTIEWADDALYSYTDEIGEMEFQVVRMRPADGSPDKRIFQRRPVPDRPDQWAYSLAKGWYVKRRDDHWVRVEGTEAPGDKEAIFLEEQRPLIYRLGDFMMGQHWVPWGEAKLRWLWVVEGEKKVEALLKRGIPATTCAQGAGKWKAAHADQLVLLGVKRVVLSPDNDAPGLRHMVDVAATCWNRKLDVKWLKA